MYSLYIALNVILIKVRKKEGNKYVRLETVLFMNDSFCSEEFVYLYRRKNETFELMFSERSDTRSASSTVSSRRPLWPIWKSIFLSRICMDTQLNA
jgi:hypothetical protein